MFKKFLESKGITAEAFEKMDAAETAKLQNEYNNAQAQELADLKSEIGKAAKGDALKAVSDKLEAFLSKSTEVSDEVIKELRKSLSDANDISKAQGVVLAKLTEKGGANGEEDNAILTAIKENVDGINKSIEQKGHLHEFVVKANTTRASVANSTDALRLQDVGQLAHRAFVMRSLFPVIPVSAGSNGVVRYTDWDEATINRAATTIAEGGVFPESTASWAEYTLDLKKIGDSIPVTEEMLQDQPRFARELEEFLNINVSLEEDTQIYGGDGVGNNCNGIFTSAPVYAPVASGIVDANFYDLIVKGSESITKGRRSKYQPNFALMSITDINRMRLKKDDNNNYIIPPFTSRDGNQVASIMVIESNAVTDNSMVLGDRRFAKIYEVEGYNVSTGVVNDQYTRDLMTMKARKRLNLLVRKADEGAFIKIADIDAALVTIGA